MEVTRVAVMVMVTVRVRVLVMVRVRVNRPFGVALVKPSWC